MKPKKEPADLLPRESQNANYLEVLEATRSDKVRA